MRGCSNAVELFVAQSNSVERTSKATCPLTHEAFDEAMLCVGIAVILGRLISTWEALAKHEARGGKFDDI